MSKMYKMTCYVELEDDEGSKMAWPLPFTDRKIAHLSYFDGERQVCYYPLEEGKGVA